MNCSPAVHDITVNCGYAAAALTLLPIPGSEIVAVMPLHVGMVVAIAEEHGVRLTNDSATELILHIGTTVGVSLVGSRIATTAAKIVLPGLGGLVSAPFMFASTLAIGAVADAWFEASGELDPREMRSVYKQATRRAKSEFDPTKARAAADTSKPSAPEPSKQGSLRERLEQLRTLLADGLIDDAEYKAARKRIIGAL